MQSADGNYVLSIPAGALSADVQLMLQPITLALPGGVGLAYSLDTGGAQFALPVLFDVIARAQDQVGGDGLGVAYQDATGAWFAISNATVDAPIAIAASPKTNADKASHASTVASIASSVTSTAPASLSTGDVVAHFKLQNTINVNRVLRSIGLFSGASIIPRNAIVHVEDTLLIRPWECIVDSEHIDEDHAGPLSCGQIKIRPDSYSVTAGEAALIPVFSTLRYRAPASIPTPNPVTVSITYNHVGGTSASVILVSQIIITDKFLGKYSGPIQFSGDLTGGDPPGTWTYSGGGNVTFTENPAHVVEGQVAGYDASGTLNTTYDVSDSEWTCEPRAVSVPIAGEMNVYAAEVLPGDPPGRASAYTFFLTATPEAASALTTFSCVDKDGMRAQRDIVVNSLFTIKVDCTTAVDANSPHYHFLSNLSSDLDPQSTTGEPKKRQWNCQGPAFKFTGWAKWLFLDPISLPPIT